MREDDVDKEKLKETDDRINEHLARNLESEDRKRKAEEEGKDKDEMAENMDTEELQDQEVMIPETQEENIVPGSSSDDPNPAKKASPNRG